MNSLLTARVLDVYDHQIRQDPTPFRNHPSPLSFFAPLISAARRGRDALHPPAPGNEKQVIQQEHADALLRLVCRGIQLDEIMRLEYEVSTGCKRNVLLGSFDCGPQIRQLRLVHLREVRDRVALRPASFHCG